MRNFLLLFLSFITIIFKTHSQQPNIIPKIQVASSCNKQAHLTLQVDNTTQNIDSLRIFWKRNDKIIDNSKGSDLFVNTVGKYKCTITYLGNKYESNEINIENFEPETILTIKPFGNDGCNEIIVSTFDGKFNFTGNNFSWYVNDVEQESKSKYFIPSITDKANDYRLKSLYIVDNCIYQSTEVIIFKDNSKYNTSYFVEKHEVCQGDTFSIRPLFPELVYGSKYEWYKDGKLFSTKTFDSTGIKNTNFDFNKVEVSLKTTENGLYYLKRVNTTYIYDAEKKENIRIDNPCGGIVSSTYEVVFKKKVQLNERLIYKQYCAKEPIVTLIYGKQFFNENTSNKKLNEAIKKEKIEWYFNENLIDKNLYTFTQNKEEYYNNIILKSNVPMDKIGNYQAKITYENGCEAISQPINYDGTHTISLNNLNNKKTFCLNDRLSFNNNWDVSNEINFSKFQFKWYLNDVLQSTEGGFGNELYLKESGNYQLKVEQLNTNCEITSNLLKIDLLKSNQRLNISDSLSLCEGKSVRLILQDSTINFAKKWFKNNEELKRNEQHIEISSSGNYKNIFRDNICGEYYFSEPIKIIKINKPTAIISGTSLIEFGKTADLKFELTSQAPWQVSLNTGEQFTINKSPYIISVKPLSDIKYSIVSVKNICGEGTSSGEVNIKMIILADELTLESNMALKVFPIPLQQNCEIEILDAFSKNCIVELYDATAKLIFTEQLNFENTKANKTLALSNLPSGTYTLKVQIGGKTLVRKLVK